MRFCVLGALEVWADDIALPLGARKQQVVLALLAINANHAVTVEELVDAVWPDGPPASAVANVRGYVGNLRRLFESSESGRTWIARRNSSYALQLNPDELDLIAFQSLVKEGHDALQKGDLAAAVVRFRSALAEWRGGVVVGLPRGSMMPARCAAIEEERRVTTDQLAELHLKISEPHEAVALLRGQAQIDPLRERTHALLMRALCHMGDVVSALSVFKRLRGTLKGELGIEPSQELQELYRSILRRDSSVARPAKGAKTFSVGSSTTKTGHPRELPPEVGNFVGRSDESDHITAVLRSSRRDDRRRPAVAVVYGPGGVGKSALAVHVAHRIAGDFPDGQIYVDLLGSTPGLRPLSTADVLGRVLRSLGISDAENPHDEADAVSRFRTMTATRRLLVVLDNADNAEQIGVLLPASGSCAVLVTARQPLLALDADMRLRLDGLPPTDSRTLLAKLTTGVVIDHEVAATIVEFCDNLPLAVRIAAGRLASRPHLSAQEFARRLSNKRRRLDELELDGLAVRSCIRVGYEAVAGGPREIDRLAARAFRWLGLLNVPDVEGGVVGALLGNNDKGAIQAALNVLVSAELWEPLPEGRYRLHDLVRLVAAEEAAETDDQDIRAAVLWRGLTYYAGAIRRADELLRSRRFVVFSVPPSSADVEFPHFDTPSAAKTWVDAELPSLVAAAEQASGLESDARRMVLWIGSVLWEHLFVRHEWRTLSRLGDLALSCADRHQDSEMMGWANLALGRSSADLGDWDAAMQYFEHALAVLSDHKAVGLVLNALGIVSEYRGDCTSAEAHYIASLKVVRDQDSPCDEAVVLMNLASVYGTMGLWDRSLALLKRSLAIRIEHHDRLGMGSTLCNLAIVHGQQGDLSESVACASEALEACQQTGNWVRANEIRLVRSEAHFRGGRYTDALADAEAVLSVSCDGRWPYLEILARYQRSKVSAAEEGTAAGKPEEALSDLGGIRTFRDRLLECFLTSRASIGRVSAHP